MTTNGSALARKAQALRDAGLRRITVSLDGLDDEVFVALNDVGFAVERVLRGSRPRPRRVSGDQDQHGRQAWRQRGRRFADGPPLRHDGP